MSQRPQQLMRPLLVINIVSVLLLLLRQLCHCHVLSVCSWHCLDSSRRCSGCSAVLLRTVLCCTMLCAQDVKDNHEEAAKVAPQTLQLCRMVSEEACVR